MHRESDEEKERVETLSVVATSIAAVITAWSAFQAATWSGRQTFALALSQKKRELSAQARLEGDQQMHLDADLFVAWAGAYSDRREPFATFLYERFPPRLRTATDAWVATHPRENKDAPLHPFVMPEYRVEAHQRAAALEREADEAIDVAQHANSRSDTYVLGTVVFASIILLASLGPRLHQRSTRTAMITISAVALLVAIAWLATMPVAWIGAQPERSRDVPDAFVIEMNEDAGERREVLPLSPTSERRVDLGGDHMDVAWSDDERRAAG